MPVKDVLEVEAVLPVEVEVAEGQVEMSANPTRRLARSNITFATCMNTSPNIVPLTATVNTLSYLLDLGEQRKDNETLAPLPSSRWG